MRARGWGRRVAPPAVALLVATLVLVLTGAREAPLAADPVAARAVPSPTGEVVAEGVLRRTLSYGPHGEENTYDVYLPAGGPPRARPTVLLVHGGSWEIGDKVEWVAEAVELAQRGWTAVSLNYRRTPTAPWPAPLEDVRAALRHLQERAPALGVDVQRTGALGDSVGGQLAALLGRPVPGLVPVRSVVSWSGVHDMTGLLQQRSSGGCERQPCEYKGLVKKVVEDLMRCLPEECPDAYREASPAAGVVRAPATFAVVAEGELIDPRQAWVMDAALHRIGVASRVSVLPTGVHGRGNQDLVWEPSLAFLAATLTPETTPEVPRPDVRVSLEAPSRVARGTRVELTGAVRPRALGSTVALQVRTGDGPWRTVRTPALTATPEDTVFRTTWVPAESGRVQWRALWRGGGGQGTSPVRTVAVSR